MILNLFKSENVVLCSLSLLGRKGLLPVVAYHLCTPQQVWDSWIEAFLILMNYIILLSRCLFLSSLLYTPSPTFCSVN